MKPAHLQSARIHLFLKISILAVLGVLVLWYGFIQAGPLILGPQIVLESPAEGSVYYDPLVAVRGNASHTTSLTLNGKTIHTDENGNFEESVRLPLGYTIMTIHGEDRFGRERTLHRTLVYNQARSVTLNQ